MCVTCRQAPSRPARGPSRVYGWAKGDSTGGIFLWGQIPSSRAKESHGFLKILVAADLSSISVLKNIAEVPTLAPLMEAEMQFGFFVFYGGYGK